MINPASRRDLFLGPNPQVLRIKNQLSGFQNVISGGPVKTVIQQYLKILSTQLLFNNNKP